MSRHWDSRTNRLLRTMNIRSTGVLKENVLPAPWRATHGCNYSTGPWGCHCGNQSCKPLLPFLWPRVSVLLMLCCGPGYKIVCGSEACLAAGKVGEVEFPNGELIWGLTNKEAFQWAFQVLPATGTTQDNEGGVWGREENLCFSNKWAWNLQCAKMLPHPMYWLDPVMRLYDIKSVPVGDGMFAMPCLCRNCHQEPKTSYFLKCKPGD